MRVHVPVVTTPAVRFHCGESDINMGAGECWIFDTWRRHDVVNTGDVDRIHLVMDTAGGTELWKHAGGARAGGVAGVPAQPRTPAARPFNPGAPPPAQALIPTERKER